MKFEHLQSPMLKMLNKKITLCKANYVLYFQFSNTYDVGSAYCISSCIRNLVREALYHPKVHFNQSHT